MSAIHEKNTLKRASSEGSAGDVKLATDDDVKPTLELDLNANDADAIQNPLYGIPRSKLLRDNASRSTQTSVFYKRTPAEVL